MALIVVVVAGLATAGGLVLLNRSGESTPIAGDASYITADLPVVDPVFEPRDARGNDPFFPLETQLVSFAEELEARLGAAGADPGADAAETGTDQPDETPPPTSTVPTVEFDVAELDAQAKTGLYGGTAENTCDPERLISFLFANPDLGEAWAKVQGIRFADIPTYIRGLEARVLAEPVNVLNHGYNPDTGVAYEIDTVLDAGTAVLVDADGDIRTRCYCGNPIKPKPPTGHQPPRCIVFGAYVFVQPAGSERRSNAPRDVSLTGRQTTVSGAQWIEVVWGVAPTETGWVRGDNLRVGYCPVPTNDRYCPGPGAVAVWNSPDTTSRAGWVTGVVRKHDRTSDLFAPISPVGGPGNEIVVNDFMLIRFRQAAPSVQNSAWVQLADLRRDSTGCTRLRQCVDTNGPVWDRAGGATLPGIAGVQWVEFTGHFAADPVTHAEVRLANGTGNYGWIAETYVPLPASSCGQPVRDCAEGHWTVHETPTQVLPDLLAHVNSAQVTVVGGPQDGRLQVELAPGGPTGWMDQTAFYDGHDDCRPVLICATTTAAAFTQYPNAGASTAPITSPSYIEDRGTIVAGLPAHARIGVGGLGYWIELAQLQPLPPARCESTTVPQCPTVPAPPVARFASAIRDPRVVDPATGQAVQGATTRSMTSCCVSGLFNSPNVGDVHGGPYPAMVVVVGEVIVGGTTWYLNSTGQFFRVDEVLPTARCQPACPTPVNAPTWAGVPVGQLQSLSGAGVAGPVSGVTTAAATAGPGDCCITASHTGPSFGSPAVAGSHPRFTTVTGGPVGTSPAWFQDAGGDWFPESAVVDPAACQPVSCPSGTTVVPGLRVALSNLVPGQTSTCCVEGDVFDSPAGNVVDTLPAATAAVVVEVTTLDWYRIVANNRLVWVFANQFLPATDCARTGTTGTRTTGTGTTTSVPCPGSSSYRSDPQGREVCCVYAESNDPITLFQFDAWPATLTGETRVGTSGQTEYRVEHPPSHRGESEWWQEAAGPRDYLGGGTSIGFIGQENCLITGDCQGLATGATPWTPGTSPDGFSSTCCVTDIYGGLTLEVVFTFEVQMLSDGTVEFLAFYYHKGFALPDLPLSGDEWIHESRIVDPANCSPRPCPNGAAGEIDVFQGDATARCCVRFGGAYKTVTVEGDAAGRDRGDGTWEFFDRGSIAWYPEPDFVDLPAGTRPGDPDCPPPRSVATPAPAATSRPTPRPTTAPAPTTCPDRDGDGRCDSVDNCPNVRNADQADIDGDGIGDACDVCTDVDQDLICDEVDNCPGVWNPDQTDTDGDGLGDECDVTCPDFDQDGWCDFEDNCPEVFNPDQFDSNLDGIGDACSEDDPPGVDGCYPFGYPVDGNGDGIDDACFPCEPFGFPADGNGDGKNDMCVPYDEDDF